MGKSDEEILAVLCPEMKDIYLKLATHLDECERCRSALGGYGVPVYISMLLIGKDLQYIRDMLDMAAYHKNKEAG